MPQQNKQEWQDARSEWSTSSGQGQGNENATTDGDKTVKDNGVLEVSRRETVNRGPQEGNQSKVINADGTTKMKPTRK